MIHTINMIVRRIKSCSDNTAVWEKDNMQAFGWRRDCLWEVRIAVFSYQRIVINYAIVDLQWNKQKQTAHWDLVYTRLFIAKTGLRLFLNIFTTLWAHSPGDKWTILFLILIVTRKKALAFRVNCFFVEETICAKCQSLFFEKKKNRKLFQNFVC